MRGSEWRKWDFHVHTKGTNKNDQFASKSMDEFFELFFRKAIEKNINAIGITDYFTIDNYILSKNYVDSIGLKTKTDGTNLFSDEEIKFIKNIYIFPNVELRMSPSTDSKKLINIHCIFNPDYVTHLENDFFGSLENQDRFKMNRGGFISYGKKLKPGVTDDKVLFKEGLNNFIVDPKTLKELLDKNNVLRENTIVVVSNSSKDGISGLQKHYDLFEGEQGSLDGMRKTIYEICNCVFSTNDNDIKYFLGQRLDSKEGVTDIEKDAERKKVLSERGSFKACIVGSDAHKEGELFNRFTWIKSDLSFEGLKQIIYEPEQRVKIQNEEPDFKEDRFVIDEVRFISDEKIFTPNPIKLNRNLNVIIGGKSSGKSILLYNIAKTLLSDRQFFEREDIENKYKFEEKDTSYNFEVKTKGGFPQLLYRPENENSILPQIKYLPQNYLVKLAEPHLNKKGETLLKLTRNLIKEDIVSFEKYREFLHNVKANDVRMENTIDSYISFKDKVKSLEDNLNTVNGLDVLEKNIQTNQEKIKELNKGIGLSEDEIKEYDEIQSDLQNIDKEISKFWSDYRKVQSFNKEAIENLNNLKNKKSILSNSLENNQLKDQFNVVYKDLDDLINNLTSFNTDFEIITDQPDQTKPSGKVIAPLIETKKKFEQKLEKYKRGEETRKLIEQLEKSINEEKITLQSIIQKKKEINDNKAAQRIEREKLFDLYKENLQEYYDVIEALGPRAAKLKDEGLHVTGIIKFNFPKFRKHIPQVSNMRKLPQVIPYLWDKEKSALEKVDFEMLFADLQAMLDLIENDQYPFVKDINAKTALKTIFHDYFFDYWEVEYLQDKLGHMSTGKASFVILMLIIGLSESKAPILIDQPEDNLDNRSISNELVNYLRSKKIDRQIILVTHNANVVVNADAENIIVSNQFGQNNIASTSPYQFDYINGSIENTTPYNVAETDLLKSMGIREHIADVVEGGKEAFQKREKKYSFS